MPKRFALSNSKSSSDHRHHILQDARATRSTAASITIGDRLSLVSEGVFHGLSLVSVPAGPSTLTIMNSTSRWTSRVGNNYGYSASLIPTWSPSVISTMNSTSRSSFKYPSRWGIHHGFCCLDFPLCCHEVVCVFFVALVIHLCKTTMLGCVLHLAFLLQLSAPSFLSN